MLAAVAAGAVGCGPAAVDEPAKPPPEAGFRSGECNLVTDDEIGRAAGAGLFTRTVVSDAGCFWQENTMIGSLGAGMGISTWWYRGSDLDIERTLESQVGRELTEVSVRGNKGFKAFDGNACSVYVAKGADVIAWSIQTLNPDSLPNLCEVVLGLADLSQQRAN